MELRRYQAKEVEHLNIFEINRTGPFNLMLNFSACGLLAGTVLEICKTDLEMWMSLNYPFNYIIAMDIC